MIKVSSMTVLRFSFLSVLFFMAFIYRPGIRSGIESSGAQFYIAVMIMAFFLYFLNKDSRKWLSTESFFLLGLVVVGLQWPITVLWGGEGVLQGSSIEPYKAYFVFSSWLAMIGILSALVGMELSSALLSGKGSVKKIDQYEIKNYSFYFVLALSLFFLFLISVGSDFLSGIYRGARNWSSVAGYFYLGFHACMLLMTYEVILLLRLSPRNGIYRQIKLIPRSYMFFSCAYIFIFLLLGDRGGPLSLVLCFVALYVQSVRKISLGQAFAVLVVGALKMAVVGAGRNNDDGMSAFVAGYKNFEIDKGSDFTAELAGSFRTIQVASHIVDMQGQYFLGFTMLPNALAILPFGGSIARSIMGGDSLMLSTSALMTLWINGPNATSGAGSSLVADAYLNFGVIGVALVGFLYGFIIRRVSSGLLHKSMVWTAVVLVLASLSLYISRDSVLGPAKLFVWLVLIQVACRFFVSRLYQNGRI